jgi:hypothetical protein
MILFYFEHYEFSLEHFFGARKRTRILIICNYYVTIFVVISLYFTSDILCSLIK